MRKLHTIQVIPSLPDELKGLRDIAMDLRWTWDHDAIDLFKRMDPALWRDLGHNPIKLLSEIPQEKLKLLAEDEAFLSHLMRVSHHLTSYKQMNSWYDSKNGDLKDLKVAYFSMEFGLHECLPMYSGGLGVLAGDHLKAASDLGIPLVGVGLLYQRGYFKQYLNADGWQQEEYPDFDLFAMPLEIMRDADGNPIQIVLKIGERDVKVHVWRVQVGKITLFLLDTNVWGNDPDDVNITESLYGGNTELRIRQEIVLGIGGYQALKLLGINPNIYHMNEGHSAFLGLEQIKYYMKEQNLSFTEAVEIARSTNVFTTHTPVPAGIDQFSIEMIKPYFDKFWDDVDVDYFDFIKLGGADPVDNDSLFNMAILATNLAAFVNGVSKLHGHVSREMWHYRWPQVDVDEVPITSVTNGIHSRSWVASEMNHLYNRYLGTTWQERPSDKDLWKQVNIISNEEMWRTRGRVRERLVAFARSRLKKQLARRGESKATVDKASDVLNMDALTIGFARRFATYKRALMLFQDKERLVKILTNPERPVQIILAGKAHPQDDPGKSIIRDIIHFSRDERVRKHIVFLEDYDINTARYMVQGCDVWLNTPRVPMEASGTSGMKAAINGALNCSSYDGWWAEAYEPDIGWTVGHGETYDDHNYQDFVESELLYDLLEKEIVPLYYSRDSSGIARGWTEMIKRMLTKVAPEFVTYRMVSEYTDRAYIPQYIRSRRLIENDYEDARKLGKWKERVSECWSDIEIHEVDTDTRSALPLGESVKVSAKIRLGRLNPEDVCVEMYQGKVTNNKKLRDPSGIPMTVGESIDDTLYSYNGEIQYQSSGIHGFVVRVLPKNEDLIDPVNMRLMVWENFE
jgi:glycogen phosphorylase